MAAFTTVAEGLAFAEGLRWREGALWWSDMHEGQVWRQAPGEATEPVCRIEGRPSGLGWLPDGRLLVCSMLDKRLMRREANGPLELHADLSGLVPRRINDLVVDAFGRAYVGNFGFDLDEEPVAATVLVRVDPDGRAQVVADDLLFPNGMVLADGGATLVVAESAGGRLTAFDVDTEGGLSGRRVWAELPRAAVPDGIGLDAEGAIWVASPTTDACLRMGEGGRVLDEIATGLPAYCCVLGGASGRELFVAVAPSHDPDRCAREREGRIISVEVAVPAA